MKKLFLTAALALVGVSVFAQKASDFYPAWYYDIKAGVSYTIGETKVGDLISPAVEFNAGYQFSPAFSLRGALSGFESKAIVENTKDLYRWNYAQLNVDAVFDLLNLFARNKRSDRAVNPFILAGVGTNLRFNNSDALALEDVFINTKNADYLWDGAKLSFCGRVGIGMDIRLSDAVALVVELDDNMYTDRYNSKYGPTKLDLDYSIAALAGVKFTFGAAKKKAKALAAAPVVTNNDAEAAAKAAAEKAAAEAAAKKAAAEKAAKAAADKAAAEAAAAAAARAKARQSTNNVYFTIGRNDINSTESTKIAKIADLLKAYPEAVVTISGYADKATGSPKINMQLSKKRAESVAKALEDAGVAKSRITVEFYGDTVQPYTTKEENRVTVCVTR